MDVDLKKRLLTLRETKSNTNRILRIGDAPVQVLESLPQGGAGSLVFVGLDAQKLSVYCRRVFHKLGIMDASFHTLRHTAASWRVMEGEDLYLVGQILGHKTLRMTARYAHLSPEYMAAAGTLDGIMGGVLGRGADASRMLGAGTRPILENAPKSTPVSHRRVTGKSKRSAKQA
jgi:Phage integrase family